MTQLYALVSPAGDVIGYSHLDVSAEDLDTSPNKDRYLPVINPEAPAFDPATHVNDGREEAVEADQVVWTWQIRAMTAGEVAGQRLAKLEEIKAEAARRILDLYPDWKQRNMTARGVVLLRTRLTREWSTQEAAEAAALDDAWAAVEAIRTRSDDIEAAVPVDAAGIAAFDALAGWDDE